METYPIYSAGKFVETNTSLPVINPFTGKAVAQTFLADQSLLDRTITSATAVKEELRRLPAYKRYSILMEIAVKINSDRQRLAAVLAAESAKPIRYALGEIDRAAQTFVVAAEESKRLPKEYISLDWTPAGEGKEGIVKYFPVGLIAGIAPFNFPLNLAVHKIAPAIAAACPIVLKPASSTPLSTLELAKIIDSTSLPKGAVSVLPMDRKTGNQLVTDPRFALLSFTGSPLVGWNMKNQAGKKKVILELGGNAAVIITETADPTTTINKCLMGGFAYSGQICIHVQRIYVQEKMFAAFSEAFVNAAAKLQSGDPQYDTTDISSMIDEDNAQRVEHWIQEALAAGAKLLLGGKRQGLFVEPTILTDTNTTMKVNSEEVFGPVVIIEKYGSIEDAIAKVNDSKFGLQAGIFSTNSTEIDAAFDQIEVGGLTVNEVPTFRVDHMPYGGIKESGLGREGVRYAMLDMLEPKILIK